MLALGILAAELGLWVGLWKKWQGQKRREYLVYGRRLPKTLPFVDSKFRRLAGTPTKKQRLVARGIVFAMRKLSNTKAFEYLVQAKVNKDSRFQQQTKPKRKIKLYL